MPPSNRKLLLGYGCAVLSIALAAVARAVLDPFPGGHGPFAIFFVAMVFTAWYGGLGPALLALVLGTAAETFFLPPRGALTTDAAAGWFTLLLFFLFGAVLALLSASLRGAQLRAEANAVEVARQREWLRTTLDSIGDGVIVTDAAGNVRLVNPVAASLTGWSPEEAAGQPLERIFPLLDETTGQALDPLGERTGATADLGYPTLLVARDGTRRPIESAARVKDGDSLGGVVLVFRDVTERRRTERELRASEERFRTLADTAPVMIWVAGSDRLCTFFNKPWLDFTGRTAAQEAGNGWAEGVHPDDRERCLSSYARAFDARQNVEMEYRLRRHDGAYRWVLDTGVPLSRPGGAFAGYIGSCLDITDRRKGELASRFLARASATLAALVDYESTLEKVAQLAVPAFADWCAVDMVDATGVLQRVAVAHVDPDKIEFVRELGRRYPPDPHAVQGVHNVLRTGRSELLESIPEALIVKAARDEEHLRLIRALGLQSYLCVPLASRGKVLGVLTFATAESERRFTPDDLALAEDLAHRAAVAIENARLYSEAREADRRKDHFLAMLAHELRNPLAPIQNALGILRTGAADTETLGFVREIMERQVQHLVRLVDDLLDVSRIMRGKVELRKERVELAAVIQRAVEAARPPIDSHRHQLTVALAPEPVWLEADPVRLAQVLGNLLNNSAKYTPDNGHIWLSGRCEGGEVVVRVRDTGVGIAADTLPRVFDLFMQADSSLGRSQGGLGIGLTLVRNLVEMHGGGVQAFSQGPGLGSEFVVRLPLPVEGKAAQSADGEGNTPLSPPPQPWHILLVDDNVDAVNSLALMLRLQGYDVRVAHDGTEALEAVRTFTPDVGVLDLGMPGMDGYELARRLRLQPGLAGILLVALTGWGQEEYRRRSREAGFDHHLVKPADPKVLRELLARSRRPTEEVRR